MVSHSDIKCFYYRGKYYAVLTSPINDIPIVDIVSNDFSKIELISPLLAVVLPKTRNESRKYLKALGYDVNPNPEFCDFRRIFAEKKSDTSLTGSIVDTEMRIPLYCTPYEASSITLLSFGLPQSALVASVQSDDLLCTICANGVDIFVNRVGS